jgi:signal transduction histidine kinase
MRTEPLYLRLTLTYLTVLLLGMGLAGGLAWQAVEEQFIATQRENLLAQARIIAAGLEGQPIPAGETSGYSQTTNTQPGIHTRLLGVQGAVVYSLPLDASLAPPFEIENGTVTPELLMRRPEILRAAGGEAAGAVRRISGRRVLYAAAPIYAGGEVSGLVYLATPLPVGGVAPGLIAQLAGAGATAVLLAMAAGIWLSRRIALPVENVARAAAAVSTGDLTQQVPAESGIREIDGLALAFNAMTAELSRSDQAKTAFIADVTHELRTPLTVIKGSIETLVDGALDDLEGRGALLTGMERETDRLIRMVNDLLVLTRADAGMLRLNPRPLDLAELARVRCRQLSALAERRAIRLTVYGDPAQVMADSDRLAQVLDNLLDNALRYAREGDEVRVEVTCQGEWTECTVRDNGMGIAPEHLPLIFDRFYRADPARDRQRGGAGLGLAIARSLVTAQGGTIAVESQVGAGTTLRFRLPSAA